MITQTIAQVILSIFLVLMFINNIYSEAKLSKLIGKNVAQFTGRTLGILLRYIIIFIMLYLGGYYK